MEGFGFCTVACPHGPQPAVLQAGRVVELAAFPGPPGSVRELLADCGRWTDVVSEALERELPWRPAEEVTFRPPVTDPSAIYCAGANYFDHLEEMGAGGIAGPVNKADLTPFHFLTAPSAMAGHRADVHRPPGCEKLDWEVELVAVIGRRAWQVDEADALDHVAGWTIANDVSARDHLDRRNPALGIDWLRHKSFATLLPVGPAVVPSRFVGDPGGLGLRLLVNGVTMQDSTTAKMVFSPAEQVAALSRVTPLLPGDLVLTGTPAGTAAAHGRYLASGDVMTCEIAGLGVLENTVRG